MIAIDTNVLVHAHREDSPWHETAYARVAALAQDKGPWAIAWPCLHEFLAIVTHPRIFNPPTPLSRALDQVSAWLESPSLTLLSEGGQYWAAHKDLLAASKVTGPQVHDARVAALCLQQGISELWTADRDFRRFPALNVSNPLIRPEDGRR